MTPVSSLLRIWGVGTSRTMRPHWALAELGLEYETREILPRTPGMQAPDFLRVSGRNKIPILECGDLIMGESGAILFHLADRYRDRLELAPRAGSNERAVFDDVCLFALMEMDAPLYVIRRHAGLPDVYGDAPVAVRAAREYFLRQAEQLAQRLSDGRPYLLGDAFSAADILVSTCIAWAGFIGIDLSDRLNEYQEHVTDRPAHSAAT
ncbi:MAG: glutathione S-transferase family protein, partial [Myxococcota bacterium]